VAIQGGEFTYHNGVSPQKIDMLNVYQSQVNIMHPDLNLDQTPRNLNSYGQKLHKRQLIENNKLTKTDRVVNQRQSEIQLEDPRYDFHGFQSQSSFNQSQLVNKIKGNNVPSI